MIEKSKFRYHQVMATLDLMEQSGQDESERLAYTNLAKEGGELFQKKEKRHDIHSLKEKRENN